MERIRARFDGWVPAKIGDSLSISVKASEVFNDSRMLSEVCSSDPCTGIGGVYSWVPSSLHYVVVIFAIAGGGRIVETDPSSSKGVVKAFYGWNESACCTFNHHCDFGGLWKSGFNVVDGRGVVHGRGS